MSDHKPTILVVEGWSWVYSHDTFTEIGVFLASHGYEIAYTTAPAAPSACKNAFDYLLIKGNTGYRQTLSPDAAHGSSGLKLAADTRARGFTGQIIMATSHHDEPYFKMNWEASGVSILLPKEHKLVLEYLQSHPCPT